MRVAATLEQEEQQEPAEATDEELAQRCALGKQMKAFCQRFTGGVCTLETSSSRNARSEKIMPSLVVDAMVTIKCLNRRRP
jgi:hypothetical protein